MKIKRCLEKSLSYLLSRLPVDHVTANIVTMAPNELLAGRVALITGGTSGIGFEIARLFLKSGASVVITGRDEERVQERCRELLKFGYDENSIFGIGMDVSRVDLMEVSFQAALALLHGRQIDILVNNAGIIGGDISNSTEAEFAAVIDTNLKGVFFLSQLVGRYMKINSIAGNMLFIASSSSLRPATSAYTLSKWGIRGLVLGLAKSLIPYGIVVNGVAPGPTATPMLVSDPSKGIGLKNSPLGRYALPEEIANMAVFLTSGMGRTIVGDIIYMTGGSGLTTFDDVQYQF